MKDDQDIFDNEVPAQTTEGVSPEAPEPPQLRDEAGRFAEKDKGEVAPAEPVESAPPAPVEKTSHDVPITALLDQREKRQAAERRVAALEEQLRQYQEPQRLPDPVEDAEGYTRYIGQTFQQQLQAQMLQQSRFFAEREFGKETVDEAMTFYDNQPRHVSEQFLSAPSPFHAAVDWFKRHKDAEERLAPDYETRLREKIKAELRAESQSSTRTNVPRSLAEAPSSATPPPRSSDPLFD